MIKIVDCRIGIKANASDVDLLQPEVESRIDDFLRTLKQDYPTLLIKGTRW